MKSTWFQNVCASYFKFLLSCVEQSKQKKIYVFVVVVRGKNYLKKQVLNRGSILLTK